MTVFGGGAEVNLGVWRWGWVLAVVIVAGGLLYGGERLLRAWHQRTALAEIREQVQAGRHGAAARSLAALLAWDPGSEEAAYLLGLWLSVRSPGDGGSRLAVG
jgi:hypothetical protein